jgi:hypothetical protein
MIEFQESQPSTQRGLVRFAKIEQLAKPQMLWPHEADGLIAHEINSLCC